MSVSEETKGRTKPTWVFLESNGYAFIDVYDDIVTFCRRDNRLTVYIGKYSLLPEVAVLKRYRHQVLSVFLIRSNANIRVLVAHSNGVEIIQLDDVINNSVVNGKTILSNTFFLDEPLPCIFGVDPSTTVLVLALGNRLKMKYLSHDSDFIPLGTHTVRICSLNFLTVAALLLMTCSKDACKIWNLELQQLLHTVSYPMLSPKAFYYHQNEESFLLGTQDGKIISVDLAKGSFETCEMCKLQGDKSKPIATTVLENTSMNIFTSGGRSSWSNEVQLVPLVSTEVTCCILAFTRVLVGDKFSAIFESSTCVRSIEKLIIVTSSRLCILDVATRRLDVAWKWPELGLKSWSYAISSAFSTTSHAVHFWIQGTQNEIAFFTIPLANIAAQRFIPNEGDTRKVHLEGPILSLLAREELHQESVLQKALLCFNPLAPANGIANVQKKRSLDKPVTFGHAIKSSGYAKQGPKRKMFQPITSASTHARKTRETHNVNNLELMYEKSDIAPSVLCFSGNVDNTSTPIYQLAYSPSGSHLAAALGNSVCLVLRSQMRKERDTRFRPAFDLPNGEVLCGHQSPVLSVAWSTNGRLLLTSSADRTARLWAMKSTSNDQYAKIPPRTVLILDRKSGGASNGYGEQATVRTGVIKKPVTISQSDLFPDVIPFAQFHYMDNFIYLVCRNVIRLFSYKVKSPQSVLDKGKATCSYRLDGEFPINTCNQLTAISSVNIFYSYLLLCAGSDRRLSVLDLNSNKVALEIENAHNRTITGIALNQGSMYSSLAQSDEEPLAFEQTCANNYNTYVTVAPGDGVRMWDLRDKDHVVMEFLRPDTQYGHVTAGLPPNPLVPPVTAAFSPCGRQLIVGGRVTPNQPYPVIYDTRRAGSHPLVTLQPKAEKGTSAPTTVVTWHPLRPEVTTGSHNGLLATYTTTG